MLGSAQPLPPLLAGDITVGVDALYWRVSTETSYGDITRGQTINQIAFRKITEEDVNPDYDWGVGIYGTYRPCNSSWSFLARYQWFESTQGVKSSSGPSIYTPPFSPEVAGPIIAFSDQTLTASSQQTLNHFDVIIRKELFSLCNVCFAADIGIEGLWYQEKVKANISGIGGEGPTSLDIATHGKFSGAGGYVGIYADTCLCQNLSAYAAGGLSAPIGHRRARSTFPALDNNSTLNVSSACVDRIKTVPVWHGQIGLRYSVNTGCGCFSGRFGFEVLSGDFSGFASQTVLSFDDILLISAQARAKRVTIGGWVFGLAYTF